MSDVYGGVTTMLSYEPQQPRSVQQLLPAVAICVVAGCAVIAACWAWGHSSPSLGQRSFDLARIWTARCAAVAAAAAAQALIVGVALPLIYRPRAIYSALAAVFGLLALLAAVSAAALFAAAGR